MTYHESLPITQADLDNGFYTNTAEGDGSANTDGDGIGAPAVESDENDTVNANQNPSIATVKYFADIDDKALTTEYTTVGEGINYTITLTNDGNRTM